MRNRATVCAHPPCSRKTTSPAGRCHDHVSTPITASFTPASSAPSFPRREFEPAPTVTEDGYGGVETRYGSADAPHRMLGPAIVTTFPGGSRKEEWYVHGERHRLNGPAEIERDASGSIESATYYREGKLHRIDGPAHVEYGPDGSATRTKFYVFGYDAPDGPGRALEGYSPESVMLAIEDSPLVVLIEEDRLDPETIVKALTTGVRTPDGVREVLGGAPPEWVRAYEESGTR